MSTERDKKENKTMANTNDARRAHELLDELDARAELSQEQEKLLRSFLPDLPKQKTLEEITAHVYDAWTRTNYNEWAGNIDNPDIPLEEWLVELHVQLKGLEHDAKPAHPEFLETEADYAAAPEGTIVACEDSPPCHKFGSEWSSALFYGMKDNRGMSRTIRRVRRVLRWGWGE